MIEFVGALGGIVLVDLALSGDNALVIGAAAAGLPRRQQRLAIILGGGGAIVLRIALGVIAALLLQLPLLQAIGGAVLLLVTWRLLAGHLSDVPGVSSAEATETHGESPPETRRLRSLMSALGTILVADVTMSLDNVLAVGALSRGNLPLLAGGLLLSMVILLVGSALVARLMERLPWLLDVAALVLAWTAAQMVLHDPRLGLVLAHIPWPELLVPAAALALVLATDLYVRVRAGRRKSPGPSHRDGTPLAPAKGTGAEPIEEASTHASLATKPYTTHYFVLRGPSRLYSSGPIQRGSNRISPRSQPHLRSWIASSVAMIQANE